MKRLAGPAVVVSALLALCPTASAGTRGPVARASAAPLLAPAAKFIFTNLASGVLSKVGGESFGLALSKAGFEDANTAAFREINGKLDHIATTVDALHTQTIHISQQLAIDRLENQRRELATLVADVHAARKSLQRLTNGTVTSPELRAQLRAELLEHIRTKLLSRQEYLNEEINSTQGRNDVIKNAAYAQRHGGKRFWDRQASEHVRDVVDFYQAVAAELLLLRVEYETSRITATSTEEFKDGVRTIVTDMVADQQAAFDAQQRNRPLMVPHGYLSAPDYGYKLIDTKVDAEGHHLVWMMSAGTHHYRVSDDAYGRHLPTLAQFRHLHAGRGNLAPWQYLHAEHWRFPEGCTGQTRESYHWGVTVHHFWAREHIGNINTDSGGRRSFDMRNGAEHNTTASRLSVFKAGCVLRYRRLHEGERYW